MMLSGKNCQMHHKINKLNDSETADKEIVKNYQGMHVKEDELNAEQFYQSMQEKLRQSNLHDKEHQKFPPKKRSAEDTLSLITDELEFDEDSGRVGSLSSGGVNESSESSGHLQTFLQEVFVAQLEVTQEGRYIFLFI